MYSVYGIGNPLMDFIAQCDESFLNKVKVTKGTMKLIKVQEKDELLAALEKYENVPGGSCANTLRGIALLSTVKRVDKPVFSGALGNDQTGTSYARHLEELGVVPWVSRKETATGVSLVLVTADFERTMFTYLGACQEFCPSDVNLDYLAHSKYLHITGYMWDTENQKQAVMLAIKKAKERGIKVSFDLADPFVVARYKKDFLQWIPRDVDLLFGNRDEIAALVGKVDKSHEDVIKGAAQLAPVVVMKVGAAGCLVLRKGNILKIAGKKVQVRDTIGAGDTFVAGFLYGLCAGWDWQSCAVLANTFAAAVVGVAGCALHRIDPAQVIKDAKT